MNSSVAKLGLLPVGRGQEADHNYLPPISPGQICSPCLRHRTGPGWLVAVWLIGLWSSLAEGAVLRVPADYPNIQRAIDASRNGDTVVVSPGLYNENINFKGRAITLSSTNPSDPAVVSNTVIHAVGKS